PQTHTASYHPSLHDALPILEEAEPDFSGATEAFETLRALGFLQRYGVHLKQHRDKLKDTVIWNIEEGLKLTPEKIARAQALRSEDRKSTRLNSSHVSISYAV